MARVKDIAARSAKRAEGRREAPAWWGLASIVLSVIVLIAVFVQRPSGPSSQPDTSVADGVQVIGGLVAQTSDDVQVVTVPAAPTPAVTTPDTSTTNTPTSAAAPLAPASTAPLAPSTTVVRKADSVSILGAGSERTEVPIAAWDRAVAIAAATSPDITVTGGVASAVINTTIGFVLTGTSADGSPVTLQISVTENNGSWSGLN